jgi:hypothetical protein
MECRLRKCGTPTARPGSATSASAAAHGTPFSSGAAPGASDGSVHGGSQNGSAHGGAVGGAAGGAATGAAMPNGAAGANGAVPAVNGNAMSGEKTSHSLWLYTRKFVRLLLTKPVGSAVNLAPACMFI